MKSATEIIKYIDDFTVHALDRPSMYASSPAALEEMLALLDELRWFILASHDTNADDPGKKRSYHYFRHENGCGTLNFTTKYNPRGRLSDHDKMVFQKLSEFWKKYLATRDDGALPR